MRSHPMQIDLLLTFKVIEVQTPLTSPSYTGCCASSLLHDTELIRNRLYNGAPPSDAPGAHDLMQVISKSVINSRLT